jgi:hypothetical protein
VPHLFRTHNAAIIRNGIGLLTHCLAPSNGLQLARAGGGDFLF